jgi:hypothetical protein
LSARTAAWPSAAASAATGSVITCSEKWWSPITNSLPDS